MVHIPQLGGLRRESCEWTNTNLPCINKVPTHLCMLLSTNIMYLNYVCRRPRHVVNGCLSMENLCFGSVIPVS